jgi:hypothetical protein
LADVKDFCVAQCGREASDALEGANVRAQGRPDALKIARQTEALLSTGLATREVALEALRLMRDSLRKEFNATDEELEPIADLIGQLEEKSGADHTPGR